MNSLRCRLAIAVAMSLALGIVFTISSAALAFNGPASGQAAGTGSGAIGVGSNNDVSVGTSTASTNTKLLIQASSTNDTSNYVFKVIDSSQNPLFIIRNDGTIGVDTSNLSGGTLNVNGLVSSENGFTGSVSAANVTAGTFGNNTGGGNYAFPGNLATYGGTTAQAVNIDGNQIWATNNGSSAALYLNYSSTGNTIINQNGGDVGIGTGSPQGTLDVAPSGGGIFLLRDSGGTAGTLRLVNSGGDNYVESGVTATDGSAAPLYFTSMDGASTWLTIAANGNVGIGTASPGVTLDVQGPNAGVGSGNEGLRIRAASTDDWLTFGTDSTNRVSWIRALRSGTGENSLALQPEGGNVGIGTTNPTSTLSVNGNASISGNLTVGGTFGGQALTGTLSAGNVSAGTFGSNTGGGTYQFSNGVDIATTGAIPLYINGTGQNVSIALRNGNATSPVQWCTTSFCSYVSQLPNGNLFLGADIAGGSSDLTVQQNGNVGIGTTSPGATLDVLPSGNSVHMYVSNAACGSGYAAISLTTSAPTGCSTYTLLGDSSGGTYLNAASGEPIYFREGNSNKGYFDGSGNLDLMGTVTAPTVALNNTNTELTQGTFSVYNSGGTNLATGYPVMAGNSGAATGFYAVNEAPYNLNYVSGDYSMPYGFAINDPREGEHAGFLAIPQSSNGLNANMVFYVGNDGSNQFQFVPFTWDGSNNHLGTPVMTIGAFSGVVNVPGTLEAGNLSGAINAGNVSAGTFGSNTGNGYFSFPSDVFIDSQNALVLNNAANTANIQLSYAPSNGNLYVDGGITTASGGTSYIGDSNGVESLDTAGVRGANNGVQQLNLYDRVSIGYPNGWGSFPTAPAEGIYTYGGADLAVNEGSVGIGTTAPGATLEVNGNTLVENGDTYQAKNSSGAIENYLWPRWSDNIMYLNYGSNGFNIRNDSSVSTMFMTNGGEVGIGTTSPNGNLDVEATGISQYGNAIVNYSNPGAVGGTLSINNFGGGQNAAAVLAFGVDDSTNFGTDGSDANNAEIRAININGNNQAAELAFSNWNGNAEQEDMRIHWNGDVSFDYGLDANNWIPTGYSDWNTYGTGAGGAAIYNDDGGYKTLMIVGNNSSGVDGGERQVHVWDDLTVDHNLTVNGTISGSYAGSINAANVSAGTFGANVGNGTYGFPGVLNVDGGSSSNWAALNVGATAGGAAGMGINAAGSIYSYQFICTGNNNGNCASAGGVVLAPTGSNAYGNVYITGSGNTYFNGGNVGIGTASPGTRLDVEGATGGTGDVAQFIDTNGTNGNAINVGTTQGSWGLLIGDNSAGTSQSSYHGPNWGYLINVQSAPLVLGAGNAPVETITSGGNVGIGTTAPDETLEVNGHISSTGSTPTLGAGCGSGAYVNGTDVAGVVTMGSGAGTSCFVVFHTAYAATPVCAVTPMTDYAFGGGNPGPNYAEQPMIYYQYGTSEFEVAMGPYYSTFPSGYTFSYICIGH